MELLRTLNGKISFSGQQVVFIQLELTLSVLLCQSHVPESLIFAFQTVSAVKTFFFSMLMNPSVQSRAQSEIDAFVAAEHRLPSLQDRAKGAVPFVECIIKEILRWHPASPIGLFHATAQDDVYQGYYIPAKTTIIANIWAMMHDETVYPNPEVFDPDRFSGKDGRAKQDDPREIVFGFGRRFVFFSDDRSVSSRDLTRSFFLNVPWSRVCPGQYLADNTMWIQMVLALACLNIQKDVDDQGKVIEPEIAFTTAIVR